MRKQSEKIAFSPNSWYNEIETVLFVLCLCMAVSRISRVKNAGETMQYKEFYFGENENQITVTLLDKTMGQGLTGMISSPMFRENIAIVIVEDPDSIDYNFACLGCGENGVAPRVAMTKKVYDELKEEHPVAKVILLHEIGHYYNSDIGKNEDNSDERKRQFVIRNEACPKEIKADAFAVKYLGKKTVIKGLQELQRKILVDFADHDEESVQITIKEIDMRISHIKGKV